MDTDKGNIMHLLLNYIMVQCNNQEMTNMHFVNEMAPGNSRGVSRSYGESRNVHCTMCKPSIYMFVSLKSVCSTGPQISLEDSQL